MVTEPDIKPAPERLTFGGIEYVRADLFDAIKFSAQLNKETIEAMQRDGDIHDDE